MGTVALGTRPLWALGLPILATGLGASWAGLPFVLCCGTWPPGWAASASLALTWAFAEPFIGWPAAASLEGLGSSFVLPTTSCAGKNTQLGAAMSHRVSGWENFLDGGRKTFLQGGRCPTLMLPAAASLVDPLLISSHLEVVGAEQHVRLREDGLGEAGPLAFLKNMFFKLEEQGPALLRLGPPRLCNMLMYTCVDT